MDQNKSSNGKINDVANEKVIRGAKKGILTDILVQIAERLESIEERIDYLERWRYGSNGDL